MRKPSRPIVADDFEQVDFKAPCLIKTNTNQDFKQFMSTNISKLSTLKESQPVSSEDENNDKELDDLLKSSKLLEEIRVEELSGKERRKYLDDNLSKFGGKKLKQKISLPMHLGMKRAASKRIEKKVEELKNNGIYSTRLKNELISGEASLKVSKPVKVKVDKGLFGSLGKMKKNGIMTVSKRVIDSVSKPSTKPRPRNRGYSSGL